MFVTHIKTIHRMKHLFTLLTSAALWLAPTAQAQQARETIPQGQAYTVIANPGEDASHSIRIGWHTDEGSGKSFCFYASPGDKTWHKAEAAQELCTAYDSLYSKTADNKDFYERARFTRNTVTLDGLEPGTEYVYRVGPENAGETRRFKTAPRRGGWDMALISDFHAYAPIPQRTQAAMDMLHVLEERNGHDLDMVLHAGDVCAWGGSYSFWRALYEEPYFKKYAWAGVNGNHDDMARGYARRSNLFFRYANNNPLNGYAGQEGVCYHFRYGNTLFIMLNSESMRTDEGLAAAQEWVRGVIKDHPAEFVVVVEHYQWFFGNDGRTSQYERWNRLFDECGVDLAIAGNNHIYARTNALYQGKETDGRTGTVYLQTPSSDNERGQALKEWTDNRDLIRFRWSEGPKTVGGLLLQNRGKTLRATLYDRNGQKLDQVTVKRKRRTR